MKPDFYKCIKGLSTGEYKEKGSKFLAFAHPIRSEEEIKSLLDNYKKQYFDARHICHAYILGTEREVLKSSDAGEPNGTAGLPILNQLRSFEVKNVLLVVVRYFGGTKLGASGLVHAYKTAAQEALALAEIVQLPITVELNFSFPYLKMNEVMRFAKEQEASVLSQEFSESDCAIHISILRSQEKGWKDKIADWERSENL